MIEVITPSYLIDQKKGSTPIGASSEKQKD